MSAFAFRPDTSARPRWTGRALRRTLQTVEKWPAALPALPVGALYFGLTTTLAAFLALFVAFWLELPNPSSAMVTVLIVAAPVRGMVLSKSLYRMIGTFVGCSVALVLVDLLGQYSELFFLALALWIGACTAAATLLRNFRAYSAILSGYTVALIGIAAIQTPEHAFDITIARVAVITVGIVCAGLVSSILMPGGARRDLAPRLRDTILLTLELAHDALDRPLAGVSERRYLDSTGRILALNDLVEFGAAESPRVARQANTIRSAAAALIAAITALPAIAEAAPEGLAQDPELIPDLRRALDEISVRLRDAVPTPGDILSAARERLALAADRVEQGPEPSLRALQLIDNLDELVEQLGAALLDLDAFVANRPARTIVSIGYHRDVRGALRNGFRAVVGVVGAGAFCYAIGWSDGGEMAVIVAVLCSLLAITPNPFKAQPRLCDRRMHRRPRRDILQIPAADQHGWRLCPTDAGCGAVSHRRLPDHGSASRRHCQFRPTILCGDPCPDQSDDLRRDVNAELRAGDDHRGGLRHLCLPRGSAVEPEEGSGSVDPRDWRRHRVDPNSAHRRPGGDGKPYL